MKKILSIAALLSLITLFSCRNTERLLVKGLENPIGGDSTRFSVYCTDCKTLKGIAKADTSESIHITTKSCFLPYEITLTKNLKYLSIFNHKLKVDKRIKGFLNLKTLWITGEHFSKPSQCWFMESPNLELLAVDFVTDIKVLEKISEMKQLKTLMMGIKNFNTLPNSLENLQDLETLSVGRFDRFHKLIQFPKFIGKMKNLKEININVDLSDNIQYLESLNNLKILSVYSFKKFDSQYLELQKFSQLKEIIFYKKLSKEQLEKLKKILPGTHIFSFDRKF